MHSSRRKKRCGAERAGTDSKPGHPGWLSRVSCSGVSVTSLGGAGAIDIEDGCENNREGLPGQDSTFNGAIQSGGLGGNFLFGDFHGQDSLSWGSGGGGGAEKGDGHGEGSGGDGGGGRVLFKWFELVEDT